MRGRQCFRFLSHLVVLAAVAAALAGCASKTAPLAGGLPPAQQPRWVAGDTWEFTTKNRSPFTLSDTMSVAHVGEEILLIGRNDPNKSARLNADLSVRESRGGLLNYTVNSGKDAYIFFPLVIGEERTFKQSTNTPKGTQNYTNVVTVEGAERITVPAGTFDTFVIRVKKSNDTGWSGSYRLWYAPQVKYFVRIVDTHNGDAALVKYTVK